MKWIEVPVVNKYFTEGGEQIPVTDEIQVPVKYKFCCGHIDSMRKAAKIKNYLRQHFVSILNTPRKMGKLNMLSKKIKSLFKFGSK
jgi:hypothetical protein